MSDTRAALEAALAADPDDLAAWHALADYLIEAGDPRGEFMRVQLALEDESLPKAERDELGRREAALFGAHAREWVGDRLYAAAFGKPHERLGLVPQHVARGWLGTFETVYLGDDVIAALATTPEARWVRHVSARYGGGYEGDPGLAPLAAAPFAGNLRSFRLGEDPQTSRAGAEGVVPFVRACPRLESLTLHCTGTPTEDLFDLPLPNLRELSVNCCDDYWCDVLAANPSLGNLRSIHFFPHMLEPGDDDPYLTAADLRELASSPHLRVLAHLTFVMSSAGDEGCRALVEGGLLFRLETLDLSHGFVTDAGAAVLADALRGRPHRLRTLRLVENALTEAGIAALRATGIEVEAGEQLDLADPERVAARFYHGDME